MKEPRTQKLELIADKLSIHYITSKDWILDDVSFTQCLGKVSAIIGPSGCGKTSFIRTLCGLIPHSIPSEYAGSVTLDGVEIAEMSVKNLAQHVSYVGQNPDASVITRVIFDDVAFALQNLCLSQQEIQQRVEEALAAVGLSEQIYDDPWTLSGGQRQRLSFACAIAMQTKMLILDEPTSTIDIAARENIYAILRELKEQGYGIVIIDHNLDPILELCDQILALDEKGRVIACESPNTIFANHLERLKACGVWLPKEFRNVPSYTSPQFDILQQNTVKYLAKDAHGVWREVRALDDGVGSDDGSASTTTSVTGDDAAPVADDATPATIDIKNFSVPGRAPAISMRFTGGECIGLVGVNGSGKTSFLTALSGLMPFKAYHAYIEQKALKRGKHLAGFVFQNPEHQMVTSSVRQELAIEGLDDAEVDRILSHFHLQDLANVHPLALSGGQLRRLSVATIVANKHKFIMLDEPMYGQDWNNTLELLDLIGEQQKKGCTIIMAIHDLELAYQYCTHIIALPAAQTWRTNGMSVEKPAEANAAESARRAIATVATSRKAAAREPWGLNPFTLSLAALPLIISLLFVRHLWLNSAIIALGVAGVLFSKVSIKQKLAMTSAVGIATAAMIWLFNTSYHDYVEIRLYTYGGANITATVLAALLALMFALACYTTPEAMLTSMTTCFKVPYRVTSVGQASIAFVSRFTEDFKTLRVARSLREVGKRYGIFAGGYRWVSAILPLIILAVQHGERVSLSMDSRAFGAFDTRTEYYTYAWRARDWICMLGVWAATAALCFFLT